MQSNSIDHSSRWSHSSRRLRSSQLLEWAIVVSIANGSRCQVICVVSLIIDVALVAFDGLKRHGIEIGRQGRIAVEEDAVPEFEIQQAPDSIRSIHATRPVRFQK